MSSCTKVDRCLLEGKVNKCISELAVAYAVYLVKSQSFHIHLFMSSKWYDWFSVGLIPGVPDIETKQKMRGARWCIEQARISYTR
jgi:hypothetical protein